MSDPITKILHETAATLFTAAEKKQFKQLGETLRRAHETQNEFDAGGLARRLANANAGQDQNGAALEGIEAQRENLARCKTAIDESPLHLAAARADEHRVYAESKPHAHRLIVASVAAAEKLLSNPPALPLPPALAEWEIFIDLTPNFCAPIEDARRTLQWEVTPPNWSRSAVENGCNYLQRAGLFQ